MLSRSSRLHQRADFRAATRLGRRVGSAGVVLHAHLDPTDPRPLVGFVVGRTVGPAVTRNRVRRRLQHIVAARLPQLPPGDRLVVRATPGAAGYSSAALAESLDAALVKAYR